MIQIEKNCAFSAKVTLFPLGFGGRQGPYLSNTMRIGVVFDENETLPIHFGAVMKARSKTFPLGKELDVTIQFFVGEEANTKVNSGADFKISEGGRIIGNGTWK